MAYAPTGKKGNQADEDRDPCARTILGNRTRRDVHVDVVLLEHPRVDPERWGTRFNQAQRRLGALFHDIAELAGERKFTVPRHPHSFDKQDLSAEGGPGQAGSHSWKACAQSDLAEEFWRAQVARDRLGAHTDLLPQSLGKARRQTPADGAHLAIQLADSGLARVRADDFPQRVVRKGHLLRFEPIFSDLPRDKIPDGNRYLLLFRVSG